MVSIHSMGAVLLLAFLVETEACTWTYDGSCYNYVTSSHQNFWAAEAYCNTIYNGHLLSIESQDEDNFVRSKLLDSGFDISK